MESEMIARPVFNYDSLEIGKRSIVQRHTIEIHQLARVGAESIVAIGRNLAEVRPILKGRFCEWLETEFNWSERSAYNFIRVWMAFGGQKTVSNFAPSALYLLSAPSVPRKARKEALQIAASGKKVSHKTAARIIKKQSTAPPFAEKIARQESPQLYYADRLRWAIENGAIDYNEERLVRILHKLADIIKERVPLAAPDKEGE